MHASGSFANRLTQDGPINVRPQLFAAHKAAGRALNRRTPFCRHLPGHPVTHVLGLYPKTDGKFAHATHSVDGSLNGSHALITHYVEHVCQRPVLCQPPASVYAGGVNETPIELVLRLAQQKKWNQAQLAEHLGVTDQSITNWKKRGLPMDKLPLIAEKLGRMYGDLTNDKYPAMMACEVNNGSPSAQTQDQLLKCGYPHFYIWPKKNRVGGGYTNAIGW